MWTIMWTPSLICKILYIILRPHLTCFAFFIYYFSKFLTSLPPRWTFSKHLHFLSWQFQSVNGGWHPSNIILAYFCQSLIPQSHSRELFAISLIFPNFGPRLLVMKRRNILNVFFCLFQLSRTAADVEKNRPYTQLGKNVYSFMKDLEKFFFYLFGCLIHLCHIDVTKKCCLTSLVVEESW